MLHKSKVEDLHSCYQHPVTHGDSAYHCSPGRGQQRGLAPRESHFVLQFLLEAGADLEVPAALW